MEVTVVRLRRHGVKIPGDRLDAEPRRHGHLSIYYWHMKNHREDRVIRELVLMSDPRATCQPIMKLTSPDQTQLNGMDRHRREVEHELRAWTGAALAHQRGRSDV